MNKKEIKTDNQESPNRVYNGLVGRCSTCSHWNREEIYNWPEKIYLQILGNAVN